MKPAPGRQPTPKGSSDKRRVYIVDDHPFLREGLRQVIDQQSDLMICGEASSAAEALREIGPTKPDIALIDLSLDGSSGLDLIKDLVTRHRRLPLLVLSMHDETLHAGRALRAGALGYVMKREPMTTVLAAIRRVLTGQCYVSEKLSSKIIRQSMGRPATAVALSPADLLSDRELEVFELLGRGHRRSTIAGTLHLSVKTVETHCERIKQKLKLNDADALRQHAAAWVQPDPGTRAIR